ncbi:EAL domain-containing protein [Telluria mixta]|uniref:EAL domain-containing protein n=1 Tax=Telluria mixta TaxID=34071 RepID=A0ABT2C971_9BURK|nr:EAL domain-containing protein [Telluria mixta]MCS0633692.1 EAL domain-containing protein [Telluria mixta]WEM98112.1 EAL domain-containing protein [Telluria mixta]
MANRVLIISAVTDDVLALRDALGNARDGPFDVEDVPALAAGVQRLAAGGIDAVLLNLTLPDAQGMTCFDRLYEAACHIPILTLCDLDDEAQAKEAVQRGAQGWLSRGYFDNYLVPQSLRNVIERMKVEQRLYIAQTRAQITLNSIGDAVISVDMHGCVDYLNVAAERMTGWSRDEARGRRVDDILAIVDNVTGRPIPNPLEYILRGDPSADLADECVLIDRQGSRLPIEDSAAPIHDWNRHLVGAVMVFRDISHNVALTAKMRHLAQHDFLTNLPSRMLLNDRVSLAIALARRSNAYPVLLFLDLDKFKHINDSLGHGVGDQLLQAVAERLLACVRTSDTVSRYGGDEFVILLADERHPQDAALTAEKILHALATPFLIGEQELHTSTSIGIGVFPFDGTDAVTLIKNADTAMYHAKERGRNNYQFFHQAMNQRAVERQLIESNLRRALEQSEFTLHYQPKVDLQNHRITGVEALLRWMHPEWGLVQPERFIAIAEECGLIVPIGRWVLREACLQIVRWREASIPGVSIAVNVSAVEFRQRDFFDHALAILEETGADPACLQLELTETVLMRDVATSADLLARFKALGVKIAVDDFGTGYSSLSYLSQFPIDVLKIDQSFVRAIDGEAGKNGAIVGAVIDMGRNLHQRVIAEGVEDEEQLAFLKAHECNEAQGYLFSRPVDAALMQAMFGTGIAA